MVLSKRGQGAWILDDISIILAWRQITFCLCILREGAITLWFLPACILPFIKCELFINFIGFNLSQYLAIQCKIFHAHICWKKIQINAIPFLNTHIQINILVFMKTEIAFSDLSFITWVQSEFTVINIFKKWEQIVNSHCTEKNTYLLH